METQLLSPVIQTFHELDALFKPRSIAIIGASQKDLSIGNVILKNLLLYGYTGSIYPINPKMEEIRGVKAYPTIFDVPDEIDLAHVIVPAKFVPQIIDECGRKGIKAVIINSAGFSEMGDEGIVLQNEFMANAQKYGIRVFGPNCQGIINTDPEFRAYCDFTFTFPNPGNVSIVALSGGVGAFIMQSLFDLEIGMRLYASNGNACDVSIAEVIQYYGEDDQTKAIILYTEGLSDPIAFMEVAREVTRKKPILAMKAGRTEEGAKAAASHTGALAGVDISTELIFEKTGILAFSNEEELCQAAMAFATQPLPKGNRVGVITNTGGPAVIATDELVNAGLRLPDLSDRAKNILQQTLLPEATIGNPIDVVATGAGVHFRSALDVLLEEDQVDAIFINFVTAPFTDTDDVARNIVEVSQMRIKPVICNFMTNMSLERFRETARILKEGGVPCYSFPTTAAKALGALYRYGKLRAREIGTPGNFRNIDKAKVEVILHQAQKETRQYLAADRVYEILGAYGIPVAKWWLANDIEEAINAAENIGFPVVIKAESADIIHKSDMGGVAVNLKSAAEVMAVADGMTTKFGKKNLKYLVQKFLPGGKEFISGISSKPGLGHLVMFGLGGVYVELFKDVVFKIAPVTEVEAREMLTDIKSARLLDGIRGEKGVNKEKLVEILQRLSQLVTDFPGISEMDLNPIIALNDQVFVVDARIKIN